MRRSGGYNNQTAVIHNNPHGHHQNHRLPSRMYHHPQPPPTAQPPQLLPYGHPSNPRPLSFPSPPLSSNSLNPQQQQQLYAGGGPGLLGSGGNGPPLLLPPGNSPSGTGINPSNSSNSTTGCNSPFSSSLSSGIQSTGVVGGDMPPVETVVARLETACRLLHGIGGNNTRVNEIGVEIQILSEDLRRVGPLLETAYPDVLDRVMSSMRDASAQPSLPPSLRLAIFELVELRASKWLLPSDSSNYYRQRRNINDAGDAVQESHGQHSYPVGRPVVASVTPTKPEVIYPTTPVSPTSLGPSPIPSALPVADGSSTNAKTFREEVVIKNSDSGKVAPTAKERVLSINGYSQQSISMAKQLIQETIQRNASPVFDGLVTNGEYGGDGEGDGETVVVSALKKLQPPSTSEEGTQFSYSVTLGDEVIKISGSSLQFVQEAKLALDDYFSQKYPELFFTSNNIEDEEELSESVAQLAPKYDRTTLLSLSLVKFPPPDFQNLDPEVKTSIILEKPKDFNPEKFCREMSGGPKSSGQSSSENTP